MYDKLRQMQKMLTKSIQELDDLNKKHIRLKNAYEKLLLKDEKLLSNYKILQKENDRLKEKIEQINAPNLSRIPKKKIKNVPTSDSD